MLDLDARLARWCSDHDGVISVDDAASCGIGHDALHRRAVAGILDLVHPGVYRHRVHPRIFRSDLRAALVAVGDRAFVSGPSLLRLFDVRGDWSARPELTVIGSGDHVALPGVRVRRLDRVEPTDLSHRMGFPILAPPLGLLLLGASVPPWKVETAVHDMVFQRFTTRNRLVGALVRYGGRGRTGTVAFRRAVRSLDPNGRATQTNLELRLLSALRDAGFPEAALQVPVVDGDGRRRRLDLAWPDVGLNVETDGDRWHLNPRDQAAMATRDRALERVGWHTERVSGGEVDDDLEGVLGRIRPFLGGVAAPGAMRSPEKARMVSSATPFG